MPALLRTAALAALAAAASAIPQAPAPEPRAHDIVNTTHRQLQATGPPDQCTDPVSFQAWLAGANQACCTKTTSHCANGIPTDCDAECANILKPLRKHCKTQLTTNGLYDNVQARAERPAGWRTPLHGHPNSSTLTHLGLVQAIARTCPAQAGGASRGCPKSIPGLPAGLTQVCTSVRVRHCLETLTVL